jgi:hypothetical protein
MAEAATSGASAWSIWTRSASLGLLISGGLAEVQPARTAQTIRSQNALMTPFFSYLRGVSKRPLPYITTAMTQRNKCLDLRYALRYRERVVGVNTE